MAITQKNRLLNLTTALGEDVLLIRSIDGSEGISELFRYSIECFAPNSTVIDFSRLIGTNASVKVYVADDDKYRYFNGIVQSVTRGNRSFTHTAYTLTLGPELWLLGRRAGSAIYQQKSVPDILRTVFGQLNDVVYELQGAYEPRDYCVQYRETDYDFACRLMEEEGIYFYFKHSEGGHQLLVADTPQSHAELDHFPQLHYTEIWGGHQPEALVFDWNKLQTLRSGQVTLWDHTFELPHRNLEGVDIAPETVAVGTLTHKLKVAGNDKLELYDYPGAYAQRFDGIAPAGAEQASSLEKIFTDNLRTAKVRMQQESVQALRISARTSAVHLSTGHKFTLAAHWEDNGAYVITRMVFSIPQRGGYSGESQEGEYPPPVEASFDCIPIALPFRPQRATPKPVVHGTQTAVVVGPQGEEIFTDKYGRVKVQMLWDRTLSYSGTASCWCRVAMPSAGKNWGFFSLPRVGQEVVVAFEEGDPDRPIITGSVYNADQMPAYTLPDNKTMSTWKTLSSPNGGGFNELRFEDKKDAEQVFVHAQKMMDLRVVKDRMEWVGQDTHLVVVRDQNEHVQRDINQTIDRDVLQKITRDHNLKIAGKQAIDITGASTRKIGGDLGEKVTGDVSIEGTNIYLKAGQNLIIEAGAKISLKIGSNFVDISASGVAINGSQVLINSGGSAGTGTAVSQLTVNAPVAAVEAATADPGAMKTYSGREQTGPGPFNRVKNQLTFSPAEAQAIADNASRAAEEDESYNPAAEENRTKTNWIGIRLKDRYGKPVPGQDYRIELPNGEVYTGTLDGKGEAKVEHIDPGNCKVSFPGIADWRKA
ncbi:MAG: type VI secretion system tip protein VgrG [Acidobacteria bacterium]|nr:type VI secretion system tip protein VgrG [Acidobacteriota bacterium]